MASVESVNLWTKKFLMLKLHQLHKNPNPSTAAKLSVGDLAAATVHIYPRRQGTNGQDRTQQNAANFERPPAAGSPIAKTPRFSGLNDKFVVVSLSELSVFADGATVDIKALVSKSLVDKMGKRGIILGGDIQKKLNIKLPMSKSVRAMVEKIGGSVS